MLNWPNVSVNVKSLFKTTVNVSLNWNQSPRNSETQMADPHVEAMASGAVDPNLLTIGLNLLKKILGLDTPIATFQEFLSKIASLISTAELISGFTPSKADDVLVAKAKDWLSRDIVLQVMWAVYQQFVKEPSLAHEITPERFASMVQEETEKLKA